MPQDAVIEIQGKMVAQGWENCHTGVVVCQELATRGRWEL